MNRLHLTRVILFIAVLLACKGVSAATYKGRLEWLQKVELRLLESGVIKEVNIAVGQRVKKGTVLLTMDQREARAKLAQAQAQVARTKLASEEADREYGRTQELYDQGLIADQELRDVELKKATAAAEAATARASEVSHKVALEYTQLRAPFDAIILARNVWEGDVVYKSLQQTPPVIIAPGHQMLARFLVPADVLRKYRKGQAINLNIKGKAYKGRIYSLGVESVRIDPGGAVYEMDFIFNVDGRTGLRQAEVVQVNLP